MVDHNNTKVPKMDSVDNSMVRAKSLKRICNINPSSSQTSDKQCRKYSTKIDDKYLLSHINFISECACKIPNLLNTNTWTPCSRSKQRLVCMNVLVVLYCTQKTIPTMGSQINKKICSYNRTHTKSHILWFSLNMMLCCRWTSFVHIV